MLITEVGVQRRMEPNFDWAYSKVDVRCRWGKRVAAAVMLLCFGFVNGEFFPHDEMKT